MKITSLPSVKDKAIWKRKFAFLPVIVSISEDGVVTKVWFTWFETRSYLVDQGKLTVHWVIEDRAVDSSVVHTTHCQTAIALIG